MGHFVRLFQLQPPASLFVQRALTIPHQLHQVKNSVPPAGAGVKGTGLRGLQAYADNLAGNYADLVFSYSTQGTLLVRTTRDSQWTKLTGSVV